MKLVIYVIAMCLLLTAGPASAEWFADAYVGQSFTLKDDMSVHSPSGLSIYQDTEFDRAFIIGGRFGRYLDAVPFLGFGVDLSTFMPTIGPQQLHIDGCVPSGGCSGGQGGTTGRIDVDVITVSLDVLLRLPLLKSDKAPWGAIQPYITAGLPFSQTTVTPRTTAQFRNQDGDSDYTVGYKVGGGIAFQVAPALMVFAEYRYMHSEVSVDLHDSATLKQTPVHFNLDTHFAVLGLSARW
jgi:Outer membrane protein beta-barrel domain